MRWQATIVLSVLALSYGTAIMRTDLRAQDGRNLAGPRVFVLDAKQLELSRKRIRNGDQYVAPAWAELEREARKALTYGPFSIVNKSVTPPSGDKRDYLSQAPYFWPDPKSPNGLPYIRRDGERNPEINKITDHRSLDDLEAAVETLALAYYFKGDERYAVKAAELLRAFFLDPVTRMNPHLQYAQFIPGVNSGRGIGLIETRGLTRVVDAIGLLAGSESLPAKDLRGLQDWFSKFLQWMQESNNGKDESAAKNNHGTYYDVQAVSFALFVGQEDLARRIAETAKQKRIALQIEPDGRQPLELERTRAWGYSNGNLEGLMELARLAESVNVDLWNYQTKDGRGIRRALDYLYAFAVGDQEWKYQQLGGFDGQTLFPLLRRAAGHYKDAKFIAAHSRIPKLDRSSRESLLAASGSSAP